MKIERVMFVVNEFPYPVRSGAHIRNTQLIAAASAVGSVSVFSLSEHQPPAIRGVDWVAAPNPPINRAELARRSLQWLRDEDGHPSDYLWNTAVATSLEHEVDRLRPDVVVLEEIQTRRAFGVVRPLVPAVVYDSHNVLTNVIDELLDDPSSGPAPTAIAKISERTKAAEAVIVAAADQVWVCSHSDRDLMRRCHPGVAPLAVVPNTVEQPLSPPVRVDDGRLRVAFSATFGYPPNVRAARWLTEELLPALRVVDRDVELLLIGAGPRGTLDELASSGPGVTVTGPVDEVVPFLARSTVAVIPIKEGGGTRFKALEAMANRVCVVSTEKGVEGLEMINGKHYLRAETTEEFALAIERVYRDPSLATALTDQAFEHVSSRFFFDQAKRAVARAFDLLDVSSAKA